MSRQLDLSAPKRRSKILTMSALPSRRAHGWSEPFHGDRIVLFGGSARTLDLLRLAVTRSDNVLLILGLPDDRTRRFAEAFGVEVQAQPLAADLASAVTALVSTGDPVAENAILRSVLVGSHSVRAGRASAMLTGLGSRPSFLNVSAMAC